MKPPTEKQLRRIAAHGRLIDHDYTRKEASDIISQLVESGEEPDWSLADQHVTEELIDTYLAILKQESKQKGLDELEKDQILCEIDDLREDLKVIAQYSRERARERIREFQYEFTSSPKESYYSEWSEQIKKPTQAQLRACVEALDREHPGWENSMGLHPLVSTLLATYPDLEKRQTTGRVQRNNSASKAGAKGCLITMSLILAPLLLFILSKIS
jgi:hypothetical protein